MATLFLARRRGAAGFTRPVALKVVHPHLAEDQSFVTMFRDEALLCGRIDHPNVVRVEELQEHNGSLYLVMEYVHGCSLSDFRRALRKRRERMSSDLAVSVAVRIADGLHAAHELTNDDGTSAGVVHRDISPSNILLGYRGDVKLIDFGIAKAAGRAQATRTGTLKGKIRYMAPEQAFGRNVDRRTDIYALGIVLWEQLTMQRLFDAENDLMLLDMVRNPRIVPPSALAPDVPPALDQVVMAALSGDPNGRPATAQQFRQMLMQALPTASQVDTLQVSSVLLSVMAPSIAQDRQRLTSEPILTPPSLSEMSVTAVARLVMPFDPAHQRALAAHILQNAPQPINPSGAYTPIPNSAVSSITSGPGSTGAKWATPPPMERRGRRGLLIGGAVVAAAIAVAAFLILPSYFNDRAQAGDGLGDGTDVPSVVATPPTAANPTIAPPSTGDGLPSTAGPGPEGLGADGLPIAEAGTTPSSVDDPTDDSGEVATPSDHRRPSRVRARARDRARTHSARTPTSTGAASQAEPTTPEVRRPRETQIGPSMIIQSTPF